MRRSHSKAVDAVDGCRLLVCSVKIFQYTTECDYSFLGLFTVDRGEKYNQASTLQRKLSIMPCILIRYIGNRKLTSLGQF